MGLPDSFLRSIFPCVLTTFTFPLSLFYFHTFPGSSGGACEGCQGFQAGGFLSPHWSSKLLPIISDHFCVGHFIMVIGHFSWRVVRSSETWTRFKSSKEICKRAFKSFREPGRLIMRWQWLYIIHTIPWRIYSVKLEKTILVPGRLIMRWHISHKSQNRIGKKL